MPTSVTVNDLKINELTEAQYDAAVQGGVIGENELSVITDMTDKAVQVLALPTASATELGNIYQYVGATDASYTNGYFYKCVSDGQEPATYSWIAVEVQASSGGLPDQTGQSGKFLTTDGTDASWSDSINIPFNRVLSSVNETLYSVKYNNDEKVTASYLGSDGVLTFSIKGVGNNYVGLQYRATDNQKYIRPSNNNLTTLGDSNRKWANVYTNKLNNGADIAVPNATGTMAVISVNTTATLAVADWSSSTQTVTVSGVKADSVVFVSPDPTSASDYASAGILCTAQAANSLTFMCDTTPTNAITVNIVCL